MNVAESLLDKMDSGASGASASVGTHRQAHVAAVIGGGKAEGLRQLQQAGFPVPAFVVSPTNLDEALKQLGTPVAVRSSASVEDGRTASFAGQFRSYLNLHSLSEVQRAIEACYRSLADPNVIAYCHKHKLPTGSLRMDVIVQQMIVPELAGVAFTVNPTTGAEEVVIEAVAGFADELLSGRAQSLASDSPLMQKHREKIETLARKIQRHFGSPQDIEFAISSGKLWVLQSRPITCIGFAETIGQWTNADFRDGGVSCRVCTPLMWSLYEMVWQRALHESLRELKLFREDFPAGRMFFGRPYWNLRAVKDCLAQLPGFDEAEFDRDLSVQVAEDSPRRVTPWTLKRLWRAVPTVIAAGKYIKRQTAAAESLRRVSWRDTSNLSLGELILDEYYRVENIYFRTIFAASLAKMDFYRSFPAANDPRLVSALPPLAHMTPIREVQALEDRTSAAIHRVIDAYPHHYRRGLDICFPRWDEDREFVAEMLAQLPSQPENELRPLYQAARASALAQLPRGKRWSFQRKLDQLRQLLWLREELRDISGRVYHAIRQRVLQLGAKRGLGDSIFFQSFQDILADDRSRIERNREVFQSYRNFEAPNEIGKHDSYDAALSRGSLQGIGAAPGFIVAPAFVAGDVQAALQMPPGQILVCPFTDPGWTAVLDRAGGVVTETGGLLSHAAVLCREFGIPAVLGVKDATKRIASGCVVEIHGGQGHVKFVSSDERKLQ